MPHARTLVVALVLGTLSLSAAACGGGAPTRPSAAPTDDLAIFADLGRLAGQRVHESTPGATLHQVDVAPGEGRYTFRFVDAASGKVVSATGKAGAAAPASFALASQGLSVLANPPSTPIDLAALRLGPDGVVAVMVRELGAATPRALTLVRQDGGLAWRVEVNGPRGIVRGTVADATGQFVREGAPP